MYEFAPGCKSRENGQGGRLGERRRALGGEGSCCTKCSKSLLLNRSKPLILPFRKVCRDV